MSKRAPRGEATTEDFYCMPPWVVEALLPFILTGSRIWEPTHGAGSISDVLRAAGHTVHASDKFVKPNYPCRELDFLTQTIPDDYDWVVFNPPFSQLAEFLGRACSLGKPFAMLCPLYTLETPSRQALIKEHKLSVLLPPRRANFRKENGDEKKGTPFLSIWLMKNPEHENKILI